MDQQKINSTFLSLIPDGYFRDYLDVMVDMNNEMPLPFHFLSIAVVLGNYLGFDTYGKLGRGVLIYPNINAILLSPAGKCRRGEGSKFAIKVARRAGLNVLEGKATPEGLVDELIENGDVILYVEELSMLLSKRDYMRPIIPLLTKFLLNSGGPQEERTRTRGEKITIPKVNLSALFTTAPDWFLETIPEEAYGGGLMSRFLPCYIPHREIFHVDPNAEGDDEIAFTNLAVDLAEIKRCSPKCHIKMTDEGVRWFSKWYEDNEKKLVEDERMDPHRNRAPASVIRLAILLAVSNGEGVISKDRVEQAVEILNWIAPTIWAMYGFTDEQSSGVSRGEKSIILKLQSCMEGTITHTDLMRSCLSRFKRGRNELKMCMEGLEEKGLVVRIPKKGGLTKHWPPAGWRLVV